MRRGRRRNNSILIALAGAAVLLLNFPLLLIWDRGGLILGLPVLPVALFLIWGGLIAVLAWVSEARPRQNRDNSLHDPPEESPEDRAEVGP